MHDALLQFLQTEILGDSTTLGAEDDLLLSGLVDSIGMMRLVAFIEESFEIAIPPEDVTIESFRSVAAISEYLTGRLDG